MRTSSRTKRAPHTRYCWPETLVQLAWFTLLVDTWCTPFGSTRREPEAQPMPCPTSATARRKRAKPAKTLTAVDLQRNLYQLSRGGVREAPSKAMEPSVQSHAGTRRITAIVPSRDAEMRTQFPGQVRTLSTIGTTKSTTPTQSTRTSIPAHVLDRTRHDPHRLGGIPSEASGTTPHSVTKCITPTRGRRPPGGNAPRARRPTWWRTSGPSSPSSRRRWRGTPRHKNVRCQRLSSRLAPRLGGYL